MKKTVFQFALIIGLQLSITTNAQQAEQITVSVPDFARPLVEKWTEEYQKNNANVHFKFTAATQEKQHNSISVATTDDAVLVARYALLPVASIESDAGQRIGSRGLNAKRLKSLFFVQEDYEDASKKEKREQELHIITGNSQQSASRLYATHFHKEIFEFKGKKIQGDDSFLNIAMTRDPLGVTVNFLSNIYDLGNRQLLKTLVLLPLDIDRRGRQVLSEGQLDDIIQLLENEQYAEIPIGNVGLDYNHSNPLLSDFVNWILTNGLQYVHQYGLLSLTQKQLIVQRERVEGTELAQK